MFRGTLGIMVVALVLVAACVAVAQDGVNIVVADEIVARVRDKGSYESVQARADAIHQSINAAVAGQDPARVEVSLKQADGLWTVYIGDTRVISVLPAEADANGMAPHVLGSIWNEKLKKALPDFTPTTATTTVTDLGNPLEDEPTTAPAPTTSTPTTTPAPAPTTTTTTEVIEIPVASLTPAAQPTAAATQPTVAAAQGATLLIIDAFNKVRGMTEDEYVRDRQQRAGGLLDDLLRVVSGGAHGLPDEPSVAVPDTGVSTITVDPGATTPTSTVEEIPLDPTTGPVTVVGTGPAPPPPTVTGTTTTTGSTTSAAELSEGIPAGDPSWAKVPQKRRIGKKFEAAQQPYLRLKAGDPTGAAQVNELLKAARREFAAHNFDLAEEYLDGGLRMLGVTQW